MGFLNIRISLIQREFVEDRIANHFLRYSKMIDKPSTFSIFTNVFFIASPFSGNFHNKFDFFPEKHKKNLRITLTKFKQENPSEGFKLIHEINFWNINFWPSR